MTYNEILVALTVHTNDEFNCDKCPYFEQENCSDTLMADALDLILTQNFEYKRLKKKEQK